MKNIKIYDTRACCATGGKRSPVDATVAQFAADLDWLETQGVRVTRYNLVETPEPFALNPIVALALDDVKAPDQLNHVLPIVFIDGAEHCAGRYPSRGELSELFGRSIPTPVIDSEEPACGGGCQDCGR
ncbi:arsenic metallochaperone ArsD family protein [Planctomycetota bacterium]